MAFNPMLLAVPAVLFALALRGRKKKAAPTQPIPPDIFEREEEEEEPPPPVAPPPPVGPPPPDPLRWQCPELAPGGDPAVCEIQKEINGHLDRLGYQRIPENGLVDERTCGANEFLASFGDMPLFFDCALLGLTPIDPIMKERPGLRDAAAATLGRILADFRAQCGADPNVDTDGAIARAQGAYNAQASIRQYEVGVMAADGELRDACPYFSTNISVPGGVLT